LSDEETPDVTPDEPEAAGTAPEEPSDAPAEEPTAASPQEPAEAPPEEPAAEEPATEAPVEEPVAEQPPAEAAEEALAEEEAAPEPAEEPVAEDAPAETVEEAPAEDAPAETVEEAPAEDAPAPVAEQAPTEVAEEAAPVDEDAEELPETPRVKPEIPGLELEPDIAPEADQYLDAEAQAAAEAEAEAAAARAKAEDEDASSRPIADAAIDLAAGARYTATGKRKTAVARVTLKPGKGEYLINSKPLNDFFPRATLQKMIRQPLEAVGYDARMDVVARMHGGGVSSQAGALRHGISRALIEADPNLRGELKRRGFLTRDPRVKERKKAGLKKARKRPQFSKR
jgi:small subunit ribosomal protein S9